MMKALSLGLLVASVCALAACDDDPDIIDIPDAPSDCDPAAILPGSYRPIPTVSTGMLGVNTNGETTIDATAGGQTNSADNPYIYVDLTTPMGMKVAINDLDARTSSTWDIALKRSSLRVNGGDSGSGGRKLAVVQAATLAEVTAAPSSGYNIDDFADASCMLVMLQGGEPMSAFGQWYNYDTVTHEVTQKGEVYVLERPDGTHTALRIISYYRVPRMGMTPPMGGANYSVEWKQL